MSLRTWPQLYLSWSYHQHHMLRDWEESYPLVCVLGNRHSKIGLSYRPQSGQWISFSPSWPQSGSFWREAHQTKSYCRFRKGPVVGLQPVSSLWTTLLAQTPGKRHYISSLEILNRPYDQVNSSHSQSAISGTQQGVILSSTPKIQKLPKVSSSPS